MKISIVASDLLDSEKLLCIQKQAFKPLYDKYHDEQSPYLHTLADMQARIARDDADYYKIMVEGELAGGLCVYNKSADDKWVAIVYVAPAYQNQKVAQTALKLAEAKYPGAKTWGLDFPIDRMANKKCYKALGYNDTGKRLQINEKLTLAVYEKTL